MWKRLQALFQRFRKPAEAPVVQAPQATPVAVVVPAPAVGPVPAPALPVAAAPVAPIPTFGTGGFSPEPSPEVFNPNIAHDPSQAPSGQLNAGTVIVDASSTVRLNPAAPGGSAGGGDQRSTTFLNGPQVFNLQGPGTFSAVDHDGHQIPMLAVSSHGRSAEGFSVTIYTPEPGPYSVTLSPTLGSSGNVYVDIR